MTGKYEIRLGETLKNAWDIFCRGPEIFISIAFATLAVAVVLSGLPLVGPLIALLVAALGPAAIYLAAAEGTRAERISFQSLNPLTTLAPQLLMLFVVKAILVGIGSLLLVLPGIYLAVVFAFAELFVVLEGKNFLDALRASKDLASQNLLGMFGLTFFLFFFAGSGALLIGLGTLITVPLALLVLFCVFRRAHVRVVG